MFLIKIFILIIFWKAQALIAVDGNYGTISEAAIALKLGKPVIALAADWDLPGLRRTATPQEGVEMVWTLFGKMK